MPSSALLVVGACLVAVAAGLWWTTWRLRRDVAATRRLLRRVTVAADEVERVEHARRQLGDGVALARGGANGVSEVVRRSGLAVAGIPYAILDGIGRVRRRNEPS